MRIEINADVDKEKIGDIVSTVMKTTYEYFMKWQDEMKKEMAKDEERHRQKYQQ